MRVFRIVFIVLCFISTQISFAQSDKWIDGNVNYINHPQLVKTSLNSKKSTHPESTILKIRKLLQKKRFNDLNELLDTVQKNVENNIKHEESLFTSYNAFEINDESYNVLLNEWVEATPTNYQPYLARASYYYRMGWLARGGKWSSETKDEQFKKMGSFFNKAVEDIAKTLTLNEFSLIPYYLLVGIAKTQSGHEEAIKVINKALALYPASYILREKFLNFLQPRWGGSYEQMQALIDEALNYESKNDNIGLLRGYLYGVAGKDRVGDKLYNEAENLYVKALSFGENHKILKKRGRNNYKREKYLESVNDFNRAIVLYPEDSSYYYNRSRAYTKLNQFDNAISDILWADKLKPNDASIKKYREWLAAKLVRQGYDLDKRENNSSSAIKKYNDALQLEPSNASTYYRRARAHISNNQFEFSIRDLKKSIELDPNLFDTYLLLDWVLAKRKDWTQIINYWDQYIALKPDNSRAYVERGGAYYHQGNIRSAVSNAKIAADMGNHDGKEAYKRFKHLVK